MGYFFLFLQAILFSFGGLMIKAAGTLVTPFLLSTLRFVIGVALLLIIQKVRTEKIHITIADRILIIGGLCKALHYLAENYGVMKGFSYGGIVVWPVQTIVILLISVFVYREKFRILTMAGTALCLIGIALVSWNGASADVFLKTQSSTLLAFLLAGIGAAGFSLAQKKRVNTINAVELNSSMFTYGMLGSACFLIPTGPHITGSITLSGILGIFLLGVCTCVGFLLQAAAIKTVPLLIATIIQSSTVILTIIWGVIFYHDPITSHVIIGSVIFLAGIVMVNMQSIEK